MKRRTSSILVPTTYVIVMLLQLIVLMTTAVEAQQEKRGARLKIEAEGSEIELYEESHALLIGVVNYEKGWKKLRGVEKDITDIKAVLESHGFMVDVLKDPTRAQYDQAVRQFIREWGHTEHNRLVIYFAGHGHTLTTIDGRQLGYLVTSDAPLPGRDAGSFREKPVGMNKVDVRDRTKENSLFKEKAISLSEIGTQAEQIESKHVLFVFDSCFSGALFYEMKGMPHTFSSKVAKPVRQFITAGTAEQEVPDESIFRAKFVEGLGGEANINNDEYVTGSELGLFLEYKVATSSQGAQTPKFGTINDPKLNQGDFVFILGKPKAKVSQKQSKPNVMAAASFRYPMVATQSDSPPKLEARSVVERALTTDESHLYRIALTPGQYLRVVVKQRGVDVKLVVIDPKGKKVADVDTPNGTQGSETLTLIAESAGYYQLHVKPVEVKAPPSSYQISVAELRQATPKERSLQQAENFSEQINEFYARGRYDDALRLAEQVLVIRDRELSANDPKLAEALGYLGVLHLESGNYKKAEPFFRRALSINEKAFGPDSSAVGVSLNYLASVYKAEGDYTMAEHFYQRALSIIAKTAGSDSLYVAKILNDLAILLEAKGDYTRAAAYHQRALQIRVKTTGPNSSVVAVSLNNLASVYEAKRDYVKAEQLYQRALSITEKAFSTEHAYVAQSLHNLAALYYSMGEYAKAEPLSLRALDINRRAFGPEHPNVAQSLDNLGSIYRAKGDYAKAEPLLQNALAIREKTMGADHPDVAITLSNLGSLYREKGDYDKAEPLLQRALVIREKGLGPQHPYVAQSLESLGLLYRAKNEHQKSLDYFARELAILRSVDDKQGEVQALNYIGKVYDSMEDKQKASSYFNQAKMLQREIDDSLRERNTSMAAGSTRVSTPSMTATTTAPVKITEPSYDGEIVGKLMTVKGTATLPKGEHLWLLVRAVNSDSAWRLWGEVEISPESQWSISVALDEIGDEGETFEIAAITVDEMIHAKLQDYWRSSDQSSKHIPTKRPLSDIPPITSAPQFRKVRRGTTK